MELKEIIKFYRKNLKFVVISSLLLACLGVLAYFYLPLKYQAAGSVFVKRVVYPYSEDHFTYEGYYGQQAAVSYTDSVIGLIKSVDVQSKALTKLGMKISEESLRQLDKKTRISKSGPQIVTIFIKDKQPLRAGEVWQALVDSTIETANQLKSGGDPYMNVSKVSTEPIVKEGYKSLPIYCLAGLVLGFFFSTFFLAVKTYLSNTADKK